MHPGLISWSLDAEYRSSSGQALPCQPLRLLHALLVEQHCRDVGSGMDCHLDCAACHAMCKMRNIVIQSRLPTPDVKRRVTHAERCAGMVIMLISAGPNAAG